MSYVRFASICDKCGDKGAEYCNHVVTCRECCDDVCEKCCTAYDAECGSGLCNNCALSQELPRGQELPR